MSLTANSEITADFSTDGKLSGSAGCNTYNAEYKTEGNAIEIGPAATTRMFCEGLMDQETAYLAALDNAATFLIQGKQLTLRDAGGATMVQYEMK